MKKQRRQNNIIICKNMLPAPSLKTKNLCKASERSHNLKKKLEKEIIEIFKIYKKKRWNCFKTKTCSGEILQPK